MLDQINEINVLKDVMVVMRDGVRLATDVYLPDPDSWPGESNSWPVLMERTPYDKRGLNRSERSLEHPDPMRRSDIARWFSAHGYAVVMQDCRGRYGSEGTFSKYLNEAEDGFDTMTWITNQDWCNGKIGTFGVSYGAHTQISAACLNPPGLACMFMDSGGFASAYHGGIRRGGAFEMKQVTWAHRHALLSPKTKTDPERRDALENVVLSDWFHDMPWSPGHSPLSAAPEYEAYLFEQWQNGNYGAYWRRLGLSALEHYSNIPDIPVMILNSWYDPYVATSVTNYTGLKEDRDGPVFLTMGPWTHGRRSVSFAGDVDFGEEAVFEHHFGLDYLQYRLAWFDTCLKGKKHEQFDAGKPVTLFIMGGGKGHTDDTGRLTHGGMWQSFDDWPIQNARIMPLYFDQSGTLSRQRQTEREAFQEYVYDPRQPTPTIGGAVTSGEPLMCGGAFDQREQDRFFGCVSPGRELRDRPDVISFETQPFEEDLVVIGPVSAKLWVSSSCPDTDFVVKLLDVHPPNTDFPEGFAMNVTDGILRVRYRESWEEPTLLEPGEVYEIEIELFATANLFKKGHRVRVDIASSNFPHFDVNPNTGEPEGGWTTTMRAKNRIYMDAERPSRILLPVVERK